MQGILISLAIVFALFLYWRNKKDIGEELFVAFIISFFWVMFSGVYNYRDANFLLFGLNYFPLVMWTGGLVLLKEVYEGMFDSKNSHILNLFLISFFYWVALFILEFIGYNIWGIQLNSNYPGIFGLPLLHLPLYGKIFYLSAGPVYLLITDFLKVE